MGAQRVVAAGQVLPGRLVEIAEGGRQAVGAMLMGHRSSSPNRDS